MKKLSILLLSLTLSFGAFAEEKQDVLKYDEQQINAELKQLNKLENYVNTHEGVTLDEVNAKTKLAEDIKIDTSTNTNFVDELPANIPAFWWGCVLGLIGILVVYLVTKDNDQTKKALVGCVVGYGIVIVVYLLVFVVAGVGAASSI